MNSTNNRSRISHRSTATKRQNFFIRLRCDVSALSVSTSAELICLEALAVNDAGARLIVLLLGDPHLLEGGQRGEDRAADPDGVLALRRRNDLHLHRGGGERGDLLRHAVGDADSMPRNEGWKSASG